MKTAKIEAIGVVGNGDVEIVYRPNEKTREVVFYRVERMGMDDITQFINSLTKNETNNN